MEEVGDDVSDSDDDGDGGGGDQPELGLLQNITETHHVQIQGGVICLQTTF